ncbi:Ubiquitin- modifier 1 [Orbilia brochopaga]|uniref:Ubiquitin-related modifier 1 n=1 Tax=Orbilia brochopaga TaxID=3140254 RepID=A0AAV9UV31_9PEZI
MAAGTIPITVELSGGLEILFNNVRKFDVELPATTADGSASNIDYLVKFLCDNKMTDPRRELFELNNTVRPGILVLINEADWELEGEGEYKLQPKDQILFISTLHGG